MASGMSAEEVAFYIRMHDEMSGPMEQAKQNVEGFGKTTEETSKKASSSFLEINAALDLVKKGMSTALAIWDATGGAIIQTARAAAEQAASLDNLAQSIGLTVEEMQELQHLANIQDVSFQQLAQAHQKLARAAYDAARGQKEQADSFRALGISVTDTDGKLKGTSQLFAEVGEALRKMESETQRTAIAQKILGESGAALVPVFNLGEAGIKRLRQEAHEMGIVIDGEAIKSLRDMKDAISRLDEEWQAFMRDAALPFVPAIDAGAEAMRLMLRVVKEASPEFAKLRDAMVGISGGILDNALSINLPGEAGGMLDRLRMLTGIMKAAGAGAKGLPAGAGGGTGGEQPFTLPDLQAITGDSGAIDISAITGIGPGAEMVGGREPGGFGEKESSKMQDQLAEELSILEAAATQRENLVAESEQKISKIKNETWKSREAQEKSHLSRMIGFEQTFGAMTNTLAQAGFINSKAAGRAQAIVSTYVGAAKALALPFPASLAAWAQVLATGKQAVKGIDSASIGGGSISGGGSGGGIGGGGGFETAPPAVAAEPTAPEKPGTIVNLTIRALNPAEAAETLAPEIEKIARDGRVSIAVRNE